MTYQSPRGGASRAPYDRPLAELGRDIPPHRRPHPSGPASGPLGSERPDPSRADRRLDRPRVDPAALGRGHRRRAGGGQLPGTGEDGTAPHRADPVGRMGNATGKRAGRARARAGRGHRLLAGAPRRPRLLAGGGQGVASRPGVVGASGPGAARGPARAPWGRVSEPRFRRRGEGISRTGPRRARP